VRKATVFHNSVFVIQSGEYLGCCTRSQLLYRVQGPHAQERSIQIGTDTERGNKGGQEDGRSLPERNQKAHSIFNPEKFFLKGYAAALCKDKTGLNRKMRYHAPEFSFYILFSYCSRVYLPSQ